MTSPTSTPPGRRIRLGISACLLGDEVRYDGGHKRDELLTRVLGPMVEWVKVCPEVEVGMGTPREPIQLIRENGVIRLRTVTTGIDHTASVTAYAVSRVEALAAAGLSGFVLKADSPSCGPIGVRVVDGSGAGTRSGVGLFAQALAARLPGLPIADERQLADASARDEFLARAFAYREHS